MVHVFHVKQQVKTYLRQGRINESETNLIS